MGKEEIEKIVTSYIKQSSDGLQIENPKFDFKERWYNLSSKPGINEFLKDTSAIANTFGPDGFIVIGYNDKTNSFYDTTFQDCKLNDTSKISDLINKKVDRLFDLAIYDTKIDGHKMSIVHIPPSINKPHVIINYQTFDKNDNIKKEEPHRIWVKKGTSTYIASKNDLELMYYDRKNIVPDFLIITSYHPDSLDITAPGPRMAGVKQVSRLTCTISLAFENLGKRPVAINEIQMRLTIFDNPDDNQKLDFVSKADLKSSNIVIQPNQLENKIIEFISPDIAFKEPETLLRISRTIQEYKEQIKTNLITLRLSNGTTIQSELIQAPK